MQNVVQELELQTEVPFTMLFMTQPEHDDVLTNSAASSTTTSVYGTTCGVNDNVGDDAETVKKDD